MVDHIFGMAVKAHLTGQDSTHILLSCTEIPLALHRTNPDTGRSYFALLQEKLEADGMRPAVIDTEQATPSKATSLLKNSNQTNDFAAHFNSLLKVAPWATKPSLPSTAIRLHRLMEKKGLSGLEKTLMLHHLLVLAINQRPSGRRDSTHDFYIELLVITQQFINSGALTYPTEPGKRPIVREKVFEFLPAELKRENGFSMRSETPSPRAFASDSGALPIPPRLASTLYVNAVAPAEGHTPSCC